MRVPKNETANSMNIKAHLNATPPCPVGVSANRQYANLADRIQEKMAVAVDLAFKPIVCEGRKAGTRVVQDKWGRFVQA
jgi:hypothetical protein